MMNSGIKEKTAAEAFHNNKVILSRDLSEYPLLHIISYIMSSWRSPGALQIVLYGQILYYKVKTYITKNVLKRQAYAHLAKYYSFLGLRVIQLNNNRQQKTHNRIHIVV